MTHITDATRKKAELLTAENIFVPKSEKLPYPLDRSTAGPGSGSLAIGLYFNQRKVKVTMSRDQNTLFSLHNEDNQFHVYKDEALFLENVTILPIRFHASGQVFINIENRCKYSCAFCNLTEVTKGFLQNYSEQRFADYILKAVEKPECRAIALTSGVYPDTTTIIEKMCTIVERIRKIKTSIPIGVEPCISNKEELISLKKVGVNEIKINLQIPDKELFTNICPDFDYDYILVMLHNAVDLFGKGKVTTNILYGLGEDDTTLINITERLAEMGVVPTLRKIRINELNIPKIEKVLPHSHSQVSPERILRLAVHQKKILEKYRLTTQTFQTMCHKCGCCDIVPFYDL